MKKSIAKLIIALLVIITAVTVVLCGLNVKVLDYNISYPNALDKDWGIRQGLDLVGGSVITYEAQTENATEEQMQSEIVLITLVTAKQQFPVRARKK